MKKSGIYVIIIIIVAIVIIGIVGYSKTSNNNSSAGTRPTVAGALSQNQIYFSTDAKVMYFYSDICSHCQEEEAKVLPVLGAQGYKVKPMDVYTDPSLGTQYNVSGTPTFVAANGDRLVGYQEVDALKTWMDQHK